MKGTRTTVGSRLMADFFPRADATAIANLKQAGAMRLQLRRTAHRPANRGPPFDESTALKVAHAYEQHTPWHTMRPPHA